MSVIDISISFQVAILGIATPILLQVILNLDQKYSSLHIIKLFKKEIELKAFLFTLIGCLLFTATYIYFNRFYSNIYDINIAVISIISGGIPILTGILIVAFLLFIRKILIYYVPHDFMQYLINKDVNKSEDLFKSFADVFYYSIKKEDDLVTKEVSDQVYQVFYDYAKESSDAPVKYPDSYYEFVEKSVGELAKVKNRWFSFLANRASGGVWFLSNSSKEGLHENTYASLWSICVISLEQQRSDFVMFLWKNLYHYAGDDLRELYYEYEDIEKGPSNISEVKNRNIKRARLFEFTHALGGLVMYMKDYDLISSFFKYTNQQPARYELLPETMTEVFEIYFKFSDPYSSNFPAISTKYYFSGGSGLYGETLVKKWVCRYSVVLFLRQYFLSINYGNDPLAFPDIPSDQSKKKLRLGQLDYFLTIIKEVKNDRELLAAVGFEKINDEDWILETNKDKPEEYISKLKGLFKKEYDKEEASQKISPSKVNKFYWTSGKILSNALNQLNPISNIDSIDNNYKHWNINDIAQLLERRHFLDNVASYSANFDSYLAKSHSRQFKETVTNIFNFLQQTSYSLTPNDLFRSVEKIADQYDRDELIIVNAGVYLGWHINQLQIERLTNENYNGIPIYNLGYFSRFPGRALYLLKKSDLPYFKHLKPSKELVEKYELKRIGDNVNYQLYASVLDLKEKTDFHDEFKDSNKTLDKYVYMYIYSSIEIRWKSDAKVVELIQQTQTRHTGKLANVSDIKFSFDKN